MDDEALRGASFLVVDDVPANVVLLTRLLRSAGAEAVHSVTDPRHAVARWLEVRPDVVLLDLQMPHLDGFAVMTALRAALPGDQLLPVLVLTADTAAQTRDRALRAGANDFLTKPFDRTEVILRVGNLLRTARLYGTVQQHNGALAAELSRLAHDEMRIAAEDKALSEGIDKVLSDGGLSMVFQPVVDLAAGGVVGVEALARFSGKPMRPPNEWFDDASRVGRGTELELEAIDAALREIDALPDTAFMAVNASPRTVMSPDLAPRLERAPVHRLVIELTEHSPVADYEALIGALDALRARGIRIAVDDAGAGYAGLSHLLHVRPDIVKLDIALTRGIDVDPARRALATGLMTFAGEIGATVVAEGIETGSELRTLRELHVTWGQGYHLARPGHLPPAVPSGSFGSTQPNSPEAGR